MARNNFSKNDYDALARSLTEYQLSRLAPGDWSDAQVRAALRDPEIVSSGYLHPVNLAQLTADSDFKEPIEHIKRNERSLILRQSMKHLGEAFYWNDVSLASLPEHKLHDASLQKFFEQEPPHPREPVGLRQARWFVTGYALQNPPYMTQLKVRYRDWQGWPVGKAVASHCLAVANAAQGKIPGRFRSVITTMP
jgi:hypothetical protein